MPVRPSWVVILDNALTLGIAVSLGVLPVAAQRLGTLFGREEQAAAGDRERLDRIASWSPPRQPTDITVFFATPTGEVFVYLPSSGAMAGLLDAVGPCPGDAPALDAVEAGWSSLPV